MCPSDGLPLAWPGGCASISIDPRNVPEFIGVTTFRTVVLGAMDRWASADCGGATHPSFHLVQYPDCAHGAEWNSGAANANVVTFRTTWEHDAYHVPSAIAVTITTFASATGDIRDADTELNLRSAANPDGFDFTTDVPTANAADLATVVTHELGHSQGLAHSGEPGAVMWFRAGLGEQRARLDADDMLGICTIYPSSRVAACDPAPRGGFTCDPGCGCAVPGRGSSSRSTRLAWIAFAVAAIAARRRQTSRAAAFVGGAIALTGCNDTRHTPATPAAATDPFGWTTRADGTLQPPDGPCTNDGDCTLRTECGCGCFATRTDFVDGEHRCIRCAAQVPFCSGATARCDTATHHCSVTR